MNRIDKAKENHRKGYTCSQAVSCAFCDEVGIDENTMFALMEGFGIGMGDMQGTCGTISGAAAILGMKLSSGTTENTKTKVQTYKVIRELKSRFKEKNGSEICCELKGSKNGGIPLRLCPGCVEDAAKILEEILTAINYKLKLKFRLAEKEDINEIFSIFQNAVDNMNNNNIFQWDKIYPNKNIIETDIEKKQMYIGLLHNKIVSAYVLNCEYDKEYNNGKWQYPDSKYIVVHRLCVNPDYQNNGIGTLTMLHIENEMQKLKTETIRLDVFTLNPYAIKMYEKLGYNKVGVADWRKGKFFLMEKAVKGSII